MAIRVTGAFIGLVPLPGGGELTGEDAESDADVPSCGVRGAGGGGDLQARDGEEGGQVQARDGEALGAGRTGFAS